MLVSVEKMIFREAGGECICRRREQRAREGGIFAIRSPYSYYVVAEGDGDGG